MECPKCGSPVMAQYKQGEQNVAQCYKQHLWITNAEAKPTAVNAATRLAAASQASIARFVAQAYDRSMIDDGAEVDEHEFTELAWKLFYDLKGGPATKAPPHLYRLMSLRGSEVEALKDGRPIVLSGGLVSFSYADMENPAVAEEAFKRFGFHDAPCTVIAKVANPGWRLLNVPELYKMCGRKVRGVTSTDIEAEKEVVAFNMRLPRISGDNIIAYKERGKPWVFK